MSARKITLICIAGLALNLVGYSIVSIFNLPFYLDTSGTIFIAALGGYVPGIALGFLTKFFEAFFVPSEMYHCSVSILVAIFAAFFARKGFFNDVEHTLLIVLPLAFLAGSYDLLIDNFLSTTNPLNSFRIFTWTFSENYLRELIDKGIMTLLAFTLLRFTPPRIKIAFSRFGKKQAPLTEEMRRRIKAEDFLSSSLRNKLLAIVMLSTLFVAFSIATISYLLFRNTAIEDRVNTADGVATVVLNEIEPARIDDYLEKGYNAEGYSEKKNWLYAVKNSTISVEHIFISRIEADGYHVVFDLSAADHEGIAPGTVVPFRDDFLSPYKDDLIAGKPIPPIISDKEYGFLLTICKPFYDANGKCLYYVGVNYSMNTFADYSRTFIIKLLALFIGCFIFIFAVGVVFIENHIILPVNTMAYCARNFSYESESDRAENFNRIRQLDIRTGDEIENLYQAILMTMKNVLDYLNNLKRTKVQVANMQVRVLAMDEIAHKDSLTGIKNKTAYVEDTLLLNQKISTGEAEFCIVMIDVNFLKRVNDTYGHERGNEYLINACKLVCSVFGAEHVYRVGGDEFVVIMEGEKVSICKYFVGQFKTEMERRNANEDLQPWERISAAVGIAFYEEGVDKNADEVFKRADAQMYANKLAMKAQRTD